MHDSMHHDFIIGLREKRHHMHKRDPSCPCKKVKTTDSFFNLTNPTLSQLILANLIMLSDTYSLAEMHKSNFLAKQLFLKVNGFNKNKKDKCDLNNYLIANLIKLSHTIKEELLCISLECNVAV